MKSCLCWLNIFGDLLRLFTLGLRSKSSLAAENLFLRKQLAFYQERRIKPRRTDNPTRLTLVWLSRWFDWRNALTVVTPKTFIPLTERHLRKTLMSWLPHYNRGRPHSSLGPGIPDPPPALPVQPQRHRHRFDQSTQIVAHSVLNGLHHEYSFMARAA